MKNNVKTCIAVLCAVVAVVGLVVLLVTQWEKLVSVCPCCKKLSRSKNADLQEWEAESADYADI